MSQPSRLFLSSILFLVLGSSNAQVFDTPRHFKWNTEVYKPNVKLTKPFPSIYTPERIYSFERSSVMMKKDMVQVLHSFPTDGSPGVDRLIDMPMDNENMLQHFFLFGGKPAFLFTKSSKDGKNISLYILTFDPIELTPSGGPIEFGATTFTSFMDHTRMNLNISVSPDGEKVAICSTDPVDEATKQWSPGCWVFDLSSGSLEWGGYFKTLVYRPATRWVWLQNDGSVLVNMYARPATLGEGSSKAYPFASPEAEKTGTWFQTLRLSDGAMQHWDGWLPDGRVLIHGEVGASAGGPVLTGILNSREKGTNTELFIGSFNDRSEVIETARVTIPKEEKDYIHLYDVAVAKDGTLALVTSSNETFFLNVMTPEGGILWSTSWPRDESTGNVFWIGDRLFQVYLGFPADVKAILSGKPVKGAGYLMTPVVKSWDKSGTLSVDLPIPEKEGGKRDVISLGKPSFTNFFLSGQFIDHDHANNMKGVIWVPLR